MGIIFVSENVDQCVGSAECDFEVRAFEDVCDIGGFLTYVCEASLFPSDVVRCLVVSVGCWGSVWFYWKRVVV